MRVNKVHSCHTLFQLILQEKLEKIGVLGRSAEIKFWNGFFPFESGKGGQGREDCQICSYLSATFTFTPSKVA